MTEGIWIALIAAVQAVTLGLLGKVSKDSSITKREVKNSHKTILRDDLDKQHADQMAQLKGSHAEQMAQLKGIRRDVGRLDTRDIERGREIRALTQKVDDHLSWSDQWTRQQENADREAAKRLDWLEDTIDPRKDES